MLSLLIILIPNLRGMKEVTSTTAVITICIIVPFFVEPLLVTSSLDPQGWIATKEK